MDDQSDPPGSSRPAGSGGFRPRSAVTGFLVSLRSLLLPRPAGPAPDEAPAETAARPLGQLSAMPRASSGARLTVPGRPLHAPEDHPLRRVAGSAGRWKKRLAEARQAWPLATEAELIATDGHIQKLAVLLAERYGLSHEAAEQKVLRFLGKRDGR